VLQAEDRLRRDVVTDLLTGAFTSDVALMERAERLGFDLNAAHLPMAFRSDPERATPLRPHDLATALARELGRQGVMVPAGVLGDTVGLVYPLDGAEPGVVARRVHKLAAQTAGVAVSAGIGRPGTGPTAIAQGYREAERALAIARRLFAPGELTFFQNLGVHRLLLALDGHPELGAFYEETLATIDSYDRANRSELVPTLEAFFAADNSLAETASRLHLHRNTVAYRLRRIEQISGHQLGDPETRLALHLGLRVRHALAARDSDGVQLGAVAAMDERRGARPSSGPEQTLAPER
jgi:sugar diacid utilization regulator